MKRWLYIMVISVAVASQSIAQINNRVKADDAAFADQSQKSAQFLFQNLSTPGIAPGVVIASPSQVDPNYFYHWIRDASITFMQVQSLYTLTAGANRSSLQSWMLAHMKLNLSFQAMQNLIAGDGEPKFNVDGSAFQGPWGRPQTDGPALRAISFMSFLSIINKENWANKDQLTSLLYDGKLPTHSLIKTDLEYVANNWNHVTFDLWEESLGAHFFTLMVQRRALLEGAIVAAGLGDTGAAQFYNQQAQMIAQAVQSFYNPNANYVVATLNFQSGPPAKHSMIDSAVLLGALLGDIGDGNFAPYDDRIVASLQNMKDVFQKVYAINQVADRGTTFGRYPEDTYNGVATNGVGNPWFIATQAAAEVYYRAALRLVQTRQLMINQVNAHFYNSVMQGKVNLAPGQSLTGTSVQQVAVALFLEGDRTLERTIIHRGADGSLSEQINRGSGRMQGAANLTWSHASFLSAYAWRQYVRSLF